MNTALATLKAFLQDPTEENRKIVTQAMPRMDDQYLDLLKNKDCRMWSGLLLALGEDDFVEFKKISPFSGRLESAAELVEEFWPETSLFADGDETPVPIDFGIVFH